jgi:hypothetical protein
MKRTILKKYLKENMYPFNVYSMEEEKAIEFDNLFETLLLLLKLNHNLTFEIHNHDIFNLTLYTRNSIGMSEFSFRLDADIKEVDGQWVASKFYALIITNKVDLSSIKMFDADDYVEKFTFKSDYDEDVMLSMMRELVRCV